jgi:hypothetical protein
MEIIKQGKKREVYFVCKNCDTEFKCFEYECDKSGLFIVYDCPTCGSTCKSHDIKDTNN